MTAVNLEVKWCMFLPGSLIAGGIVPWSAPALNVIAFFPLSWAPWRSRRAWEPLLTPVARLRGRQYIKEPCKSDWACKGDCSCWAKFQHSLVVPQLYSVSTKKSGAHLMIPMTYVPSPFHHLNLLTIGDEISSPFSSTELRNPIHSYWSVKQLIIVIGIK